MGSCLFLLAFLFHLSVATSQDPQYVLIVPAVVQSKTSNEACVQILNLSERAFVNVTLEYNVDKHPLLGTPVTEKHFSQCISFVAPPASSNALAFIVLSVQGSSVNFYERRSVAIQNISTTSFVQTDKPIYKPGQRVMFRVVSLDTNLKPVDKKYSAVSIKDPQGNLLAQWLNQTSSSSILQLEFLIDPDARLGSYLITVESAPGSNIYDWFTVEEYVLPRYKVDINAPQRVSPFDEEFKVDVCSRYTYGQPVHGTVQLRVCRHHFYHPRCNQNSIGICETVNAQLGKDGCVSKVISTKAFHLYRNIAENRFFFVSLHVEGVVTETGTGVQISDSSFISVYQAKKTLMFEKTDIYYRRGLPATGQIRLRDEDDLPVANGLIFLEINGEVISNYTTDKNGIAQFSIPTSNFFESRYKLRAFHEPDRCTELAWLETHIPEAVHYMQRFFSRTDSYLKIEPVEGELPCDVKRPITVHYILNKNQHEDMAPKVHFYYIVMAKGKIVANGNHEVNIHAGQYNKFSFPLNVDHNLAPRAKLLVYCLHPHNEILADSIFFEVEKCFKNKVSLHFSKKQALPASNISLSLEAAGNSFCALQAVDRSILLLRSRSNLSPEEVYNRMGYVHLYGYHHNGLDLEDYTEEPCIAWKDTFFNGMYYVPVNVTDDGNVYDIFKNLGLKVFSTSPLRKPVVCQNYLECKKTGTDIDEHRMKIVSGFSAGRGAADMVETVRKDFPETWIWDLVLVDSSGKTDISYKVPDTITEWVANAFCVDDSAGFGLSQPASMTAFQPFFTELALPYSTIRGEEFVLKAIVFNYLNNCIEITATLETSVNFKAENLSPENNFKKICANESQSYAWTIKPLKLGTVNFTVTAEAKASEQSVGRRDTIIKSLLVEPEGVKKEVTQSSLLCVKGTPVSELVTMRLPANLVEESATASFTVLGDTLGTALRNTENLLQMPYGCGEQNIAMFLSNCIILDYLNDTKQLTEEKRSKIAGNLISGYQRQLSYRLDDGSFSTFGSRNAKGSLWLTALVYRAFAQSKAYVFIDENVLNQALIWIASKQLPNGCFQTDGEIYNNALKDEVDESVLITAHIVISLQLSGLPASYPVVRNALSCLDAAFAMDSENSYENALLAYMYGLVGKEEKHRALLEVLIRSATKTDGFLYLERKKRPQAEHFPSFYSRATSAEIEITSYMLLAWVRKLTLSQEELTTASQMVRWIVRNQNPLGGFSSTQDTPVALEALSQYGRLTFTKDAQNTVAIKGAQSFQKLFHVNSQNSVLLQQTKLPSVPGNYAVEVSGSGCVYTQTTLKYNIILPAQASGFVLSVQTKNASCNANLPSKFDIVLTASYTGKRNTSNMVIIDLKMLSGFVPVSSSLTQLQNQVMRTETRNDHVFIYLEDLSKQETVLILTLEEVHPVSNKKPAQVKIYDYYETDESGQAEYNTPCQEASK